MESKLKMAAMDRVGEVGGTVAVIPRSSVDTPEFARLLSSYRDVNGDEMAATMRAGIITHLDALLRARPASPTAGAERPTDDVLWDQTLQERDCYHDMADQLADQIAAMTEQEIGEHSSSNDPWRNALIAADEFIGERTPRSAENAESADTPDIRDAEGIGELMLNYSMARGDGGASEDAVYDFVNSWVAGLARSASVQGEAQLIRAFNSGYKSGHHDTVEGQYTDIDQRDMFTYHADVVAEMIADGTLATSTPAAPTAERDAALEEAALCVLAMHNRISDIFEERADAAHNVLDNVAKELRALKSAAPVPQLAAPQGYKLVPEMPTPAMVEAYNNVPSGFGGSPAHGAHVWEAMLDAAPASAQPAAPGDELHFNAQRLRNMAKLVGLESVVPQDDATLDGARGAVLGQIAGKLREVAQPAAYGEALTDEQIEAIVVPLFQNRKCQKHDYFIVRAVEKYIRAALAPVPAPPAGQKGNQITINGRQLRDALDAAWTDRADSDEGDTELTLFMREKFETSVENEVMVPGLWFFWTDYPEEGCGFLDPNAEESPAIPPAQGAENNNEGAK